MAGVSRKRNSTGRQLKKPVTKIILPVIDGITNLEIRRLRREIDADRSDRAIHQKTLDEVSIILDDLQRLCAKGHVRGVALCALLTKEDPRSALGVFCSPEGDSNLAHEIWSSTAQWLDQVHSQLKPLPPDTSA